MTLGRKVLVHDVDMSEGVTSASATVMSQVHFLFGILMSVLPTSYQRTEAVSPFQGNHT